MAEAPARGLLFDWGGVLTTNLFAGFSEFCREEGIDPGLIRETFLSNPEGQQALFDFETGKLDEPEFERRLTALLGLPPERAEGFNDRIFSRIGEDRPMIEALRRARGHGLRTGRQQRCRTTGGVIAETVGHSEGGVQLDRPRIPVDPADQSVRGERRAGRQFRPIGHDALPSCSDTTTDSYSWRP